MGTAITWVSITFGAHSFLHAEPCMSLIGEEAERQAALVQGSQAPANNSMGGGDNVLNIFAGLSKGWHSLVHAHRVSAVQYLHVMQADSLG